MLVEELLSEAGLMNEGESLYSPSNIMLMHHVMAGSACALLFVRDVDYIVSEGEVIIVDEHTGRTIQAAAGLMVYTKAVEAKEGGNPE